jgi:hypothetical protein
MIDEGRRFGGLHDQGNAEQDAGRQALQKIRPFFATVAMNEPASPPRMMFGNMQSTTRRNAASTAA